jgi:hypothetical protein
VTATESSSRRHEDREVHEAIVWIRTLDAIHLATLERLGETPPLVTVITRDDRVARNARASGYAVV